MIRISPENLIDHLIQTKFPLESKLVRAGAMSGVSYEARMAAKKTITAYEAELDKKSLDELFVLCERAKEQEEQQLFFNRPDANADFGYWSKMPYWTLDEAIALLFGKDPEIVRWEKVSIYTMFSPFAKQYARVHNLALRAVKSNQLNDPTMPSEFLTWAKTYGIEIPHQLKGKTKKYDSKSTKAEQKTDSEIGSPEWRKKTASKAANARHDRPGGSRDMQQKMREIWATSKYSSRDICAEQECAGLGISISTARKALRNTTDPKRT